MNLSPQQQQAHDLILTDFMRNDEKRFVLAGYAGAGKTTLAKRIADEIGMGRVSFCAYTGKAANVLREKGCRNSSTIHGAIYQLIDDDHGEPRFMLNVDSEIKYSDLVIVDEYSMLPEDIRADLESLSKKVLYLGDPFQLPPVKGFCELEPNFFIEEIHRQALENPIIRYATDVRQGRQLSFCDHPEFQYAARRDVPAQLYYDADQIIVGRNNTRIAWNNRFREKLGFSSQLPQKGDKIICTKNNFEKGLFNGMIGYADANTKRTDYKSVVEVFFDGKRELETWAGNFYGWEGQPDGRAKRLNRFDFAYAITCHKSQGSEFNHVLVYNQPVGSDKTERARWLYTAITRGKEKVTLVEP